LLTKVGTYGLRKIHGFLYAAGFMFRVLREALRMRGRNKVSLQVLVMQILFTGVNALSIIAFFSIALGAVIIIQGAGILQQLGQRDLLYPILITIITQEGGPLLTALVIMSRSGVAIATELGNMVVKHEIEAYVSVGIDPLSYLVVPRFLGVTVSLLILTVYFSVLGLGASYFFAQLVATIPPNEYFYNLLNELSVMTIVMSLLKTIVFGIIISVVSSYYGLSVQLATTEIPVITIRAVGQGFALIFLADVLITLVQIV